MIESNKLRFLIVDDEEVVRICNENIISHAYPGCKIDIRENGEELAKYKEKAHIYISDHRMPGMTGFDALRARRDAQDLTPAIIYTGTPGDLAGISLPLNTYLLTKPCDYKKFKGTIDAILADHYPDSGTSISF